MSKDLLAMQIQLDEMRPNAKRTGAELLGKIGENFTGNSPGSAFLKGAFGGAQMGAKASAAKDDEGRMQKYAEFVKYLQDVEMTAKKNKQTLETLQANQAVLQPALSGYMANAATQAPEVNRASAQSLLDMAFAGTDQKGEVVSVDGSKPNIVTLQMPNGKVQVVDLVSFLDKGNPATADALAQYTITGQEERARKQQEMALKQASLGLQRERLNAATNPTAKPLGKEAAQTTSLANEGLRSIDEAVKLAFDKKGNLRRSVVAQIQEIPLVGPVSLSDDARKLYSAMYNAINARLRIESGAAVPENEVRRAMRSFVPTPLDSSESARYKMDQIKPFLRDIVQRVGRQEADTIAEEVNLENVSDEELERIVNGG